MKPPLILRIVFTLAVGLSAGQSAGPATKAPPPAKVATPVQEATLNTITLTPQATQRLGIKTVTVIRKAMPQTRLFAGEVIIPPGRELVVNAPLAGTVHAASPLTAGQSVRQGQVLLTLVPILTPAERVRVHESLTDAQGQLLGAKAQAEAARIALTRAELLLKTQAGSQRTMDEARAAVAVTEAALKATQQRVELLTGVAKDFAQNNIAALSLPSPLDGLLVNLSVGSQQTVPAGAALFTVASHDRFWLRVAVYVGDFPTLKPGAPAGVSRLAATLPGELQAQPVAAPPSASATNATVDLFFSLPTSELRFRPGERVAVTLPLLTEAENLVVPATAVLNDIHGGQWVYERTAPDTFVRRRIEVRRIEGVSAVLARGPTAGTAVVTDGAAELFGTEFGIGK